MYLKEFDLDLPYILNDESIESIMKIQKCEYNEATKLDYELNWKWKDVHLDWVCSAPVQFSLNDFRAKNELEKKRLRFDYSWTGSRNLLYVIVGRLIHLEK